MRSRERVTRIATGVTVIARRTRCRRDVDRRRHTRRRIRRRGGRESVVLAVPAYVAANLVRDLAPDAAQGLAAIPYAPIASRRHRLSPRRRSRIRSRDSASWSRAASGGRSWAASSPAACSKAARRTGSVLLTTFVGGAREPALAGAADAELAAIVAGELRALAGRSCRARLDRDHALDARDSAVQPRPCRPAASGGGSGTRAARIALLRELPRRRVGRRPDQDVARDGGGHRTLSRFGGMIPTGCGWTKEWGP